MTAGRREGYVSREWGPGGGGGCQNLRRNEKERVPWERKVKSRQNRGGTKEENTKKKERRMRRKDQIEAVFCHTNKDSTGGKEIQVKKLKLAKSSERFFHHPSWVSLRTEKGRRGVITNQYPAVRRVDGTKIQRTFPQKESYLDSAGSPSIILQILLNPNSRWPRTGQKRYHRRSLVVVTIYSEDLLKMPLYLVVAIPQILWGTYDRLRQCRC